MSNIIALAGLSNSGKSTSFKYLDPSTTFIVSCTNKQLQIPGFRKKYPKFAIIDGKPTGNWYISNDYSQVTKVLNVVSKLRPEITTVIIDDANYLMSNESMNNALTKGFDKFTIQAKNYYDLIQTAQSLRDDITVIFVSHIVNNGTDLDPEWRLYTLGKLLNNTVNIDGLFSYIIYAERYIEESSEEVQYRFRTKTNGNDTCRSVAGCFDSKYVEPNLQLVIDTINKFENGEG